MESIDITEMTDFRHINDVCFTQLAAQQQQQQQQIQINTQGALNTSFHSCATDNFQGSMLKEQQQQREQQNPLLQSLIDYTHSLTTPPTTTIGNNYSDGTAAVAVAAAASVCNARAGEVEAGNLSMDGVHFDEHDIYYVSPTKRKSSLRATILKQQQQHYERFKTKSPLRSNTTTAAINCKQTRIATNTAYGSRLAGIVHDFSLDETSSHYSDTAMQVLRSGSISGGSLFGETQRHFALTNNNNNNNNNNIHCHSHSHSSSNSSLVTNSERFQRSSNNNNNNNNNNNLVTNKQSAHRGSLQRFKGRSTQSLCSCDAGIDAEIDMQSTRPLYQYDVDGKMAHTYTCEQNAQILMRLARERQRKLSLGAEIGLKDSYGGSTITLSKGRTKTEKQKMQYYADDIPPIPPPPTLKRQTNSSFKQKVIERNCNSRSSTLETLCSNDVGSLLEDCTASILKCANTISNELSTGKTDPNGMNAKLANTCPTGRASTNYLAQPLSIDDIFMPRTHRPADLSLCFLHTKANSLGIGMGIGMGMENTLMRSAGLKTASNLVKDNRSLYKYNTIGPSNSSEFAKQLAHYRDQQKLEREEQVLTANRCRCFSKSLSSFQYDNKLIDSADNQLCYQGSSYSNLNRNDDSGRHCATTKNNRLQFPITTTTNTTATTTSMRTSTDTLANILNDGAFVSLHDSSNTNSGLNHHQQHQYHHEHHYPHQDYLLHNHKPSITSAALHNQLLSTKVQQQKQKQKHQLDVGTQHQHLQSNVTNLMPWKHRQCPSRCSSSSGTNSLRFDAAKHWLAVSSILLIIGAASVAVPLALRVAASAPFEERLRVAQQLLDQVPLIDGHNDLPWNIRKFLHNKLNDFNFDQDLRNVMPWAKSSWSHTDLQRLKKGRVSAQFWAAYVPCEAQHRDAVQLTLEQIDVIKRLTDRYYPQLVWCTTSADIIEAHKKHQMCSLTGVEGGHSIGGSLAVMRTLYAIGVRYMTLTSTCHTPWADSSAADAPTFNVKHGGLTIFGKTIIREMNRLGMMVDLSHVSKGTMHDAIEVSEAPVIFSHSSAYALCNSSRNVQDDTLQSLAKNGGIVMVNFYSKFLSCNENATVHDAVAHINHIRRIAGVDHVGLGAGFDGINFTPKGLEDVSTYPTLFAELVGAGWNVEDLTKLAGGNFLRVMKQVEKIRDEKRKLGITPYEDEPSFRTDNPYNCTTTS